MIHEDVAYCISIHVPRTGHDAALKQAQVRAEISIHVPRTGHDMLASNGLWALIGFQSTCPVRGTTITTNSLCPSKRDFNPRAPYGARQYNTLVSYMNSLFQSTCPVRGTTRKAYRRRACRVISIHVPRTGHDVTRRDTDTPSLISIHVPRTGHDKGGGVMDNLLQFQSTCPVRGTTRLDLSMFDPVSDFNPRAPYGARLNGKIARLTNWLFQSTCPVRGTTSRGAVSHQSQHHFNPRAPYGARQQKCTNSILHFCNNRQ